MTHNQSREKCWRFRINSEELFDINRKAENLVKVRVSYCFIKKFHIGIISI